MRLLFAVDRLFGDFAPIVEEGRRSVRFGNRPGELDLGFDRPAAFHIETARAGKEAFGQLPFQAPVPEGVVAYVLGEDMQPVALAEVPANQPVLLEAQGEVTFRGTGEVSYVACPLSDDVLPIATPTSIAAIQQNAAVKGRYYNLRGMRVGDARRGLIIHNGHKLLVK